MTRTDSIYFSIPCDRYTPFSLARKIGASAILESASFARGRERYSILLLEPAFHIVQDDEGVAFLIDGRRLPYRGKNETGETIAPGSRVLHTPDILDALVYVASQNDMSVIHNEDGTESSNTIPVPASGLGYLSYEFAARCDTINLCAQTDELHIPESEFVAGHLYVVFDHFTEKIHVFALNYNEHQIDLEKAVSDLKKRLNDMDFTYLSEPEEPCKVRTITDLKQSEREYKEKVESIKKEIVAGNLLQAVPSRRLQIECDNSALEIYRRLRAVNPSPYLFYIDFGERQLIGSSPESLVRVRDGVASIRPIAGTRRRGKNSLEDEELKAELLNDAKERAEHLMLVDLARNDLGRVCTNASVEVTRFMEVELFSHVMHIVSDVQGKVAAGLKPIQVLRAAFPAGTVSGAPKISAIEILSRIEKTKRRFYAGAVGYIQSNGDLDFCIAIRCALKQAKVWSLQAGGGIVYDSNADREWEETNEKLRALITIFEENKGETK
ncbi:anthranilate synthase component I family protein [Treponema sp.]|uniref:anthranilate synthase component I family protein n=1 Tax=Treponema sp. TaxID=166 RepID=UPI00298E0CC0|nr:chorismate-binding protein [Treponema sp.]